MFDNCKREGTDFIEYSLACFFVITELAPRWRGFLEGREATLFRELFVVNYDLRVDCASEAMPWLNRG